MSPELAKRLTQAVRNAIEAHHEVHLGVTQWYVDKFVIDCDAEDFWKVAEQALAGEELRNQIAQELLDADDAYPEDDVGMAHDNLLGILRRMAGDG